MEQRETASTRHALDQPAPFRPVSNTPNSPLPKVEKPMLLDPACLPPEERSRRVSQGLCIYCGQSGHFVSRCPVRPRSPRASSVSSILMSETRQPSITQHRVWLPATISFLAEVACVEVLVQSGADDNLMDKEFAKSINCPLTPVVSPRPVKAIN